LSVFDSSDRFPWKNNINNNTTIRRCSATAWYDDYKRFRTLRHVSL